MDERLEDHVGLVHTNLANADTRLCSAERSTHVAEHEGTGNAEVTE